MAEPRIRFSIFDFDPDTRELWRDGVPVRLQAQPAQALALLIARAGEIVLREDLRQAIWGAETFVDFDRNINFCIAQIRTALGDSAETPRFIRTLPKRGYQFIAPVAAPPQLPLPAPPAASRRFPAAAIAAVLIAVAGISWWLLRAKPLAPAITIAVTRFDNETGDPAFTRLSDSLTDSLVGELTVSGNGRFAIIGNAAILRAPRQGRDLVAIGAALRAGYIVIGQVQRDGAGIRILAHLIRLPDQKHLWVVRSESTPEQAIVGQAGLARRISAEFATRLAASPTLATH